MSLGELLPADLYSAPNGEEMRTRLAAAHQALRQVRALPISPETLDSLSERHNLLCAGLVAYRTRTAKTRNLTFTDNERLVIDFSLFDAALLDNVGQIVSFCRKELKRPDDISGFRIRYVTEMIDQRFQAAQGIPQEQSMQRKLGEARVTLATKHQSIKTMRLQRDTLISDLPKLRPLEYLFKKVDQLLPKWAKASSQMEIASDLSPKERREHFKMGEAYTTLQEEETLLLSTLAKHEELSHLAIKITSSAMQIPKYEAYIEALEAQVQTVNNARQNLSRSRMVESRVEDYNDLLSHLRQCGGNFSRSGHMILTKGKNLHGKLDIIRAVETITTADVELSHRWKIGTWNQPSIGLLPGHGDAVYDETENTFWVPILLRTGPERAMASALGNYRLSASRNILAEFGNLKPFQDIKSTKALRKKFVQAYTAWCLRDSKGFRSLTREVRNWFINRVFQANPS